MTTSFNKAIGAVIRELRKERGLSMLELGTQLGFSYQQVAKYEHGQNACSAELVSRLASIFGVSIAEMYDRAGVVLPQAPLTESQCDGILAARYVGKIKSALVRGSIVDFTRKLAYQGEEA